MLSVHGVPLAIQLGVPVLALCWLAVVRHDSVIQWLFKIAVALVIILAVHLGGLWIVLPWYTSVVFLALLAVVVVRRRADVRDLPWQWRNGRLSLAIHVIAAAVAVTLASMVWMGRRPPPRTAVDLHFPLAGGSYQAVNAGSNQVVNAHLMTLSGDRFRAYRGQSHGVDLVKLGPFGLRASGLLPGDLDRYAIYGDSVLAPCAGTVVQRLDDAPDMPPPRADRTRMAGNHVLLDCGGIHVLLAHFQPGTVPVQVGERVAVGATLGRVGNSGNSNEPHLHIHAQRPAAGSGEPLSGDPLPITFGGRYLARNDRIHPAAVPRQ